MKSGKLRATADFSAVRDFDTINIAVPTPLRTTKDPDMTFIVESCREIAGHFHAGMLVILESTTYPGTTDEVVLPMLQKSGLEVGKDFFVCFSPERVDPGNPRFQTKNIQGRGWRNAGLFGTGRTVLFSSAATRGASQFDPGRRDGETAREHLPYDHIGLVNEIALMCDRIGINVWEVIDAAATKPFGFMPFYPGPGLGGHCIPIDPFYLSWKTKQAGIEARFIDLAGYINGQMPHFVAEKVQNALNDHGKPVKGSHIHIMGAAYKRDIDDVRESPAPDVMLLLQKRGGIMTYSDPHVPHVRPENVSMASLPESAAADADCAVIITDHRAFDYEKLVERARLIVDTRNALTQYKSEKIIRL